MCFSIRAYLDGRTPSAWDSVYGVGGPDGPPKEPSAATVIAINSSTIRIYWDDQATNETAFVVSNEAEERSWVDSLPGTGIIRSPVTSGPAAMVLLPRHQANSRRYDESDGVGNDGEAVRQGRHLLRDGAGGNTHSGNWRP
jgi:hypothetical protein